MSPYTHADLLRDQNAAGTQHSRDLDGVNRRMTVHGNVGRGGREGGVASA